MRTPHLVPVTDTQRPRLDPEEGWVMPGAFSFVGWHVCLFFLNRLKPSLGIGLFFLAGGFGFLVFVNAI